VPLDGAREHDALDVGAGARQVRDRRAVGRAHDVLLDDRAGVELLGDVVGGRADDLHAALVGPAVGVRAREGRQERVVDVDHRHAELIEERAREDLHVAREHHDVAAPGQHAQDLPLGLRLRLRRHRDVHERHPEGLDIGPVPLVVGDDDGDLGVELAAPTPPQQVEQAMLVARGHDRHALRPVGGREAPVERQRPGDALGEAPLEAGDVVEPLERELHAHEEAPTLGVGRVLVGDRDVRALLEQERRHRGHDPVPVGARDQQPHASKSGLVPGCELSGRSRGC
jgi:hypothetical protein